MARPVTLGPEQEGDPAATGLRLTQLSVLLNPHVTARRFPLDQRERVERSARDKLVGIATVLMNSQSSLLQIFGGREVWDQVASARHSVIRDEVGPATGFIHAHFTWRIWHRVYFPAQGTYTAPKRIYDKRLGRDLRHSEWIGRERTGMGLDVLGMQRRMKIWLDTNSDNPLLMGRNTLAAGGSWFVGLTIMSAGIQENYFAKERLTPWRARHNIRGSFEQRFQDAGRDDVVFLNSMGGEPTPRRG